MINHKKGKMLDVKKIIFLIVFFSTFQSCYSQRSITGKYQREDVVSTMAETGSKYIFDKNNNFTQTNFYHLGYKELFEGKYKLEKSILTLYYIPKIKTRKDYRFVNKKKITKNNSSNTYLFAQIKLTNKDLRKDDIELLIYDKNDKLLMGFSNDENGEFPFLSLYDSKIGYFLFSSLVYQEVKIPASELYGSTTEVNILLNKTLIKQSQKNDTIKYLIKSFSKKKVELKNRITNEKVILTKQ